jgi:hypothetical protein
MCIFAKYKNIFGEPGKGIHSYRLFNLAIIDIIFTIIGAYLIGIYNKNNLKEIIILFLIIFFIGQILHLLFCVETKFIKLLNDI